MTCEFVGYWLDYGTFSVGILVEGRSVWLAKWIEGILAAGVVLGRRMAEGL